MIENSPLIQMHSLGKVIRHGSVAAQVLRGLDITIYSGEYVAISGPSGSGKSTLLNILGMLDESTEGSYFYNGHSVNQLSQQDKVRIRNREIGFIFQDSNLIDDLTVRENVELPLLFRDGLSLEGIRLRVERALSRVAMSGFSKSYPPDLSGGQRQRVAVARALGGSPSVLLADEPTGNLDPASGLEIMSLLEELHALGSTLCVVTHNETFSRRAARTIRLSDGTMVPRD